MTRKIELLDSIMGSGKSTSVLNWCEANPDTPYLYITPLLSESEVRVVEACNEAKFIAPQIGDGYTRKGEHLLDLLQSGVNISITHQLYSSLTPRHLKYIEVNNYTLILDEEVEFISAFKKDYTKSDFEYLRHLNQITTDDEGRVHWLDDTIKDDTKYSKLANMCKMGMVYQAKRSEDMFVTQLPMDLIYRANRVILLTYLFKGSVLDSFLKMKGVEVVPFTEVSLRQISKDDIRSLIEFVGKNQTRSFSDAYFSTTWYEKKATPKDLEKIANAIRAVGNTAKVKKDELVWCAPSNLAYPAKKNSKRIKPLGFAPGDGDINSQGIADGCFLACSSRATNAYRDRSVMVHAYNRFPHASVDSFLYDYGTPVDHKQYALSELLQWIWRSRIREGKPIKLCILSRRMLLLFQDWLNED